MDVHSFTPGTIQCAHLLASLSMGAIENFEKFWSCHLIALTTPISSSNSTEGMRLITSLQNIIFKPLTSQVVPASAPYAAFYSTSNRKIAYLRAAGRKNLPSQPLIIKPVMPKSLTERTKPSRFTLNQFAGGFFQQICWARKDKQHFKSSFTVSEKVAILSLIKANALLAISQAFTISPWNAAAFRSFQINRLRVRH